MVLITVVDTEVTAFAVEATIIESINLNRNGAGEVQQGVTGV